MKLQSGTKRGHQLREFPGHLGNNGDKTGAAKRKKTRKKPEPIGSGFF
jgi:hypothetical protein